MPFEIFVSHSSSDQSLAYDLVEELEKRGAGCFVAPRDIPAGEPWPARLVEAIGVCKVFLLVLTEDANLSVQVEHEIVGAAAAGKPILCLQINGTQPSGCIAFFVSSSQWIPCSVDLKPDEFDALVSGLHVYMPQFLDGEIVQPVKPTVSEEPLEPLLSEFAKGLRFFPPGKRHARLAAVFFVLTLATCILSVYGNAADIKVNLLGPKGEALGVHFGYLYELNCACTYLFVVPFFLYYTLGFVREAQLALVDLTVRDKLVINRSKSSTDPLKRPRLLRRLFRPEESKPLDTALKLMALTNRQWFSPGLLGIAVIITLGLIVGSEYLLPKNDSKHLIFGYVQAPYIPCYPLQCPNCTLQQMKDRLGRRFEGMAGKSKEELRSYRIVPKYYERTGSAGERASFVLFMITVLGLQVAFVLVVVWVALKAFLFLFLIYSSILPSKAGRFQLNLEYDDRHRLFGLRPLFLALGKLVWVAIVAQLFGMFSWWTNILKGSARGLRENLSTLGGWGQFLVANFGFLLALLLLVYFFRVCAKVEEAAAMERNRLSQILKSLGADRRMGIQRILDRISNQSMWRDKRFAALYTATVIVCLATSVILNRIAIAEGAQCIWSSVVHRVYSRI
jgi:hypothetical protein